MLILLEYFGIQLEKCSLLANYIINVISPYVNMLLVTLPHHACKN